MMPGEVVQVVTTAERTASGLWLAGMLLVDTDTGLLYRGNGSTVGGVALGYAIDTATVHLTGNETIAGNKTLTGQTRLDAHYGAIAADADAATVTFNLAAANSHQVTLGGARTLAVTGAQVGQAFFLILKQDGTGGRTVTWFSGIDWGTAGVPTLSTGINKRDMFSFFCSSSGEYQGFVVKQNF